MTYIFHEDTDPKIIDEFVINSDQNTLFQCHEWAEVKNNWGHYFTSVTKDGETVGTALVLSRKMPLGKCLFYVPRGPVMDYSDHELVSFYIENLLALAKKHHAIVLRFDPDIVSRRYPYETKDEAHRYDNNDVIEYLKSLGAKHRGFTKMISEATQPRYNAVTDCTPDYESKLSKRTKQSIRTAQKKGAKLYEGHEYLHEFSQAMHFTETRKGVALRNEEYFRNMMEVYGDRCIIMVAKLNFKEEIDAIEKDIAEAEKELADCKYKKQISALEQRIANDKKDLEYFTSSMEKEGKDEVILAGKMAVYNDKRMEYFYMGNNADYLRIRASYLLYKAYFDICVEKGIRYVSMGGIEGTLDDGLTEFKSSWNMEIEEYIGEFNIVIDPIMYNAFDKVYPWVLNKAAQLRSRK